MGDEREEVVLLLFEAEGGGHVAHHGVVAGEGVAVAALHRAHVEHAHDAVGPAHGQLGVDGVEAEAGPGVGEHEDVGEPGAFEVGRRGGRA